MNVLRFKKGLAKREREVNSIHCTIKIFLHYFEFFFIFCIGCFVGPRNLSLNKKKGKQIVQLEDEDEDEDDYEDEDEQIQDQEVQDDEEK